MNIRKHGRTAVVTVALAATSVMGMGSAPLALAQTDEVPAVSEQLKVCAEGTDVAVVIDRAVDADALAVQQEATVKLIESMGADNPATFTVLLADGAEVVKQTFDLPRQAKDAVAFVNAAAVSPVGVAKWDDVFTAAHSVQGLDALAVFSGGVVTESFEPPASVLREAGVTVVPVSLAAGESNPVVKPTSEKTAEAEKPTSEKETAKVEKPTSEKTTAEKKPSSEKKTTAEKKPSSEKKTTAEKKPSSEKTTAEKKPSSEKKTTAEKKPSSEKKTTAKKPTSEKTTVEKKPTSEKKTTAAPKPTTTQPAPAPQPTTTQPAPAPAPVPAQTGPNAGDIIGGAVEIGKNYVENNGGLEGVVDKGKKFINDVTGGDPIGAGRDLLNKLGSVIRGFIPSSVATSALAGTTDQAVVLENAKATGLIDSAGNWDTAAITAQLAEQGFLDENGNLNPEAVAVALDAPQIVTPEGEFDAHAIADLLSTEDFSETLGAGATSSIGLVDASALTLPGVTDQEAEEVLPEALASTDGDAVIESANGDASVKKFTELSALSDAVGAQEITLEEAAEKAIQGNTSATGEAAGSAQPAAAESDVSESATPEATVEKAVKDQIPVATSEEAFEAIGAAFGDACDTKVVESAKDDEKPVPKQESRPMLASTGANVAALAGFGVLAALGAGIVIARRKK